MNSHRQTLHQLVIPINRAFVRRGCQDGTVRTSFGVGLHCHIELGFGMCAGHRKGLNDAVAAMKSHKKAPRHSRRGAFLNMVR